MKILLLFIVCGFLLSCTATTDVGNLINLKQHCEYIRTEFKKTGAKKPTTRIQEDFDECSEQGW